MLTTTATTHRPADWPADQLEFSIQEETPFSKLTRALLDRTAGMFNLNAGMTSAEYQNRWHDLVAIGHEETATARTESARLAEAGETHRRCWRAEVDRVDVRCTFQRTGLLRPPSRCLPPPTSATPETNGLA